MKILNTESNLCVYADWSMMMDYHDVTVRWTRSLKTMLRWTKSLKTKIYKHVSQR